MAAGTAPADRSAPGWCWRQTSDAVDPKLSSAVAAYAAVAAAAAVWGGRLAPCLPTCRRWLCPGTGFACGTVGPGCGPGQPHRPRSRHNLHRKRTELKQLWQIVIPEGGR